MRTRALSLPPSSHTLPAARRPPQVAAEEHNFALAGLILAVLAFIGYIVLMMNYDSPNKDYLINAMAIKAIEDNSLNGSISLSGIIA